MTAAEQIVSYLQEHGKATRPELERVFGLYEKTVDSAIRKLERLGFIERTGKTPRVPRRKCAVVFSLTGEPIDAAKVGRTLVRHGKAEAAREHSFDALNNAMRGFFGGAA
ncbi:hypothetical protein AB4Y43_01215 [Paraburkholderia sp. BR10872]|uniref:hypothetical protein n=1 Tax=Paraburkholderia sp. BR10872 TaxID=3236989 RepID=UPI0034D1942F